MQTLVRVMAVLFLFSLAPQAGAAEQNGLSVTVSKRTLNRSDRRDSFYYTRYDRTQGYKVTVKNISLKAMPEGELNWTIVLIKALYSSGGTEKYVGTEKIKALRPAESVEVMVGAVPVGGYRFERDYKDEMEYDLNVTHGGKEMIRMTSKPGFAALAKRATLIKTPAAEEEDTPPGPAGVKPQPRATNNRATPAPAPAPARVAPAAPPTAVVPPATPANRANPATPATPATPAAQTAPAGTPPPDTGGFNFFNLDKKSPPPPAEK